MGRRASIKRMRKEAPEWVFSWRRPKASRFPKWFATLLVGAAFAFLLTSVHIRVVPPTPWASRKASLIRVTDDTDSRALTLRAREGGPFPSRFEPSEWMGIASIEKASLAATRWSPPPYVPTIRDLPDQEPAPTLRLATKGEPVFPRHAPKQQSTGQPAKLKLAAVLYPLSGITAAAIPNNLPSFDGTVDATMTAEPWRFLIQLTPAGNVMHCVSLTDADEAGVKRSEQLATWLRRVQFNPEPGKPSRWIAVGVGFTNQAANGTESR